MKLLPVAPLAAGRAHRPARRAGPTSRCASSFRHPPAVRSTSSCARWASKLKERWKQPLVVENKPGAGGMLGMDVVAKAPPDGYTLGIGFNGPIAFGPFMYKKMPYDPAKAACAGGVDDIAAERAGGAGEQPGNHIAGIRDLGAQQGNKLSYGSVGNGSSSHLTMELLKSVAGFDAVHVPYAGSPPAATSLVAGDTQALFAVAPALLPLVQGGRVKFLASTSAQRVEGMKDLPTVAESGYAGFEALAWNGLFAPSGTAVDVVSRINADVNAVLAEPAVRDSFIKQGLILGSGSSADFKAFIEAEARKWGAIISEKVGIKID